MMRFIGVAAWMVLMMSGGCQVAPPVSVASGGGVMFPSRFFGEISGFAGHLSVDRLGRVVFVHLVLNGGSAGHLDIAGPAQVFIKVHRVGRPASDSFFVVPALTASGGLVPASGFSGDYVVEGEELDMFQTGSGQVCRLSVLISRSGVAGIRSGRCNRGVRDHIVVRGAMRAVAG